MRTTRITAGALQNLQLAEIVQMLALGGKTACVTVAADGREGRIWFHEGTVAHARVGDEHGEEAFYRMLGWRRGQFFIEHGSTTGRRTIDKDTMYLLIEGLRRGDEAAFRSERWSDVPASLDGSSLDAWPFEWLFENRQLRDSPGEPFALDRIAYLELRVTSTVQHGNLILLVDGEEIRRRELAGPDRAARRLLSWISGNAGVAFDERVAFHPGPHVVVARLVRADESRVESSMELDLHAGEIVARQLILEGRFGSNVVWKGDDERRPRRSTP